MYIFYLKFTIPFLKKAYQSVLCAECNKYKCLMNPCNEYSLDFKLNLTFPPNNCLYWHAYILAPVLRNGMSFCVSMTLPAIFNFPLMNATWGFVFPKTMSTKSSSLTVSVVSAVHPFGGPWYNLALFKSMAENTKWSYILFTRYEMHTIYLNIQLNARNGKDELFFRF